MQDNNTDFDKTIECIRQRKEIFACMDEEPFPSGNNVPEPVDIIFNMRQERCFQLMQSCPISLGSFKEKSC